MARCIQREDAWDLPRLVSVCQPSVPLLIPLPSRNFAATQTKGVSSSIYKKYGSKAEAEEAYRRGLLDGYVAVL